MLKLISDEPFYYDLLELVGKKATVLFEGDPPAKGTLVVYRAPSGREGWLLVRDRENDMPLFEKNIEPVSPMNALPESGYILFAGSLVESIRNTVNRDGSHITEILLG